MLKKIIFISLSLILFSIITNSTIAKVSFKEIFSSGVGKTYQEALNNAFAEAISMVNGKNIQTQTIIKIMSGQTLPSAKSNASASEEEELYGTINKILSDVFDVEEKKKEEVPKDVLKKEKKQTSNLTQQYLKEMIDKTKGGIKSYEIINKKEKKGVIYKNLWDCLEKKEETFFFDHSHVSDKGYNILCEKIAKEINNNFKL